RSVECPLRANFHFLEDLQPLRRPDKHLADLQAGQFAEQAAVEPMLGNPRINRFSLVDAVDLADNQALDLGEDFLVYGLGSLTDHCRADSVIAAEPDDVFERAEHPALILL